MIRARTSSRIRTSTGAVLAFYVCLTASAFAQTNGTAAPSQPLSVIDWLGAQKPQATPVVQTKPSEPATAQTATAPQVKVAPLGNGSPRQIGLVPSHVTGLPTSLWASSNVSKIETLLDRLPELTLPAAQSLLYTVLLADVDAPGGIATAGDQLALLRVQKLFTLGALEPALSLIEQAGVPTSQAHFDLWMQISLLTGDEDRACATLRSAPHLTNDLATRIFCAGRAGQWDNAALTFGSAQALGLIPDEKLALLDRFLHPDAFEEAGPLAAPRQMDPLSFRLFETIGEPMPSRTLPRPYAVADLRDLAGWKSQIEAAERLTRVGALPDNQLLGLYMARQPAASGGVWDRVAAIQRFETALNTASSDAVAKTLPTAWRAMQNAGLEVTFARLFAGQLQRIDLKGRPAALAQTVALLSPEYEAAATEGPRDTLTTQIAIGEVSGPRPTTSIHAALYEGFTTSAPRADLIATAKQSRLGESILHVLRLIEDGAQGDAHALRDGVATLRALGLEDIARRVSLQILLLES